MAAAAGPDWARLPVPPSTAPDTNSPVFPERPIRPLPKRRLRARLSEGEANSIDRPVDASSSPTAIGGAPTPAQRSQLGDTYTTLRNPDFGRLTTPGAYHSDEEPEDDRYAGQRSSWSDYLLKYPRGSTTSSIDGESFENTNNKKKRKIPLHHNSNFPVDANDSDSGYGPATSSWQIDGGGNSPVPSKMGASSSNSRGRNVRAGPKNGKQPLTASVNASNYGKGVDPNLPPDPKDQRLQYASGQENRRDVAPHHHHPKSGQVNDFTFTAPSESAKQLNQASRTGVVQQSQPNTQARATQGTQTIPNGTSQRPAPTVPASTAPHLNTAAPDPPVDRPTRGELLSRQAADRKREQRITNRRQRIKRQDVELCDYCLYEAIFRDRPRALLRSYELKELKKREEQANRRRLLEKAKAKSRKTRKAGRGANQNQAKGAQDQPPVGSEAGAPGYEGYDDQGEGEYYDEEFAEAEGQDEYYDEEYPPPLEPGQGGVVMPGTYECAHPYGAAGPT